jgi:hypothetical protein
MCAIIVRKIKMKILKKVIHGDRLEEASTLRICETVSTLNKRVARGGLAVQ